jgi:hypothetical protein
MQKTKEEALNKMHVQLIRCTREVREAEEFKGFWWDNAADEIESSKQMLLNAAIKDQEVYEYIYKLIKNDIK